MCQKTSRYFVTRKNDKFIWASCPILFPQIINCSVWKWQNSSTSCICVFANCYLFFHKYNYSKEICWNCFCSNPNAKQCVFNLWYYGILHEFFDIVLLVITIHGLQILATIASFIPVIYSLKGINCNVYANVPIFYSQK